MTFKHFLIARMVEKHPRYFLHLKEHQATPQLLDAVSDRISKQYIRLGLELGLRFEKIDQCRLNNPHNTVKVVREILGEWMQKNKGNNIASLDNLADALLRSGCTVEALMEFVDQKLSEVSQTADGGTGLKRRKSTKCLVM